MSENETQQEAEKSNESKEPQAEITESGNSLVQQANAAAERLERANKETAEIIRKQEELMARRRLGGETLGNQKTEDKKDPDKENKEYAQNLIKKPFGDVKVETPE